MSPALLIAALVLDAVMGEPRWLWSRIPHPAVLMGRLIGWTDTHLNNNTRLAGSCVVFGLVIVGAALGGLVTLFGPWAEAVVTAILLAQRSLVDHVAAVARDLRLSLTGGRNAVAMIVSRNTDTMTTADVSRAAIESGAENLSDGIIAPAFWALIGGVPGIVIYKFINTADSMIGYRTAQHENFGWAAARLDDVLNWVPARLTALLFWLVGGIRARMQDIRAEAVRHKSPNAGWPEAALARNLNVALAGPRRYHGALQDLPWVNPTGHRAPNATTIEAAIQQLWYVWWLFGMVLLILSAIL